MNTTIAEQIKKNLNIPEHIRIGQYIMNNYLSNFTKISKNTDELLKMLMVPDDFFYVSDEEFIEALKKRDRKVLRISYTISNTDLAKFNKYTNNSYTSIDSFIIPNEKDLFDTEIFMFLFHKVKENEKKEVL